MVNIKIYNKGQTSFLELPKTRDIKISGEMVYEETTMISGKTVMDIRGYRAGFTATWDWFPNDLLTQVLTLIRQGGYFPVEFTDDTGTTEIKSYKISQSGQAAVFTFRGGMPVWHGITLDFTAQEVTANE